MPGLLWTLAEVLAHSSRDEQILPGELNRPGEPGQLQRLGGRIGSMSQEVAWMVLREVVPAGECR
jgi:hypothetical protein